MHGQQIFNFKVEAILNSEEQVTEISKLTKRLAQVTLPQNQSLLPNDLQTSSEVLSTIVNVLEANSITNDVRIVIASEDVFARFTLVSSTIPTLCTECN